MTVIFLLVSPFAMNAEAEVAALRQVRTALEGLRVLLQRVGGDVKTYAANCDALGGVMGNSSSLLSLSFHPTHLYNSIGRSLSISVSALSLETSSFFPL
jgi:hypothetical protein